MAKQPPSLPPSTPSLSDEDMLLWNRVKKLTKPLASCKVRAPILWEEPFKTIPIKNNPKAYSRKTISFVPSYTPSSSPDLSSSIHPPPPQNFSFNQHTFKKISKRSFQFSSSLDLHGKTLDSAFHDFRVFITKNHLYQQRFLLIITGKGSGFLRSALPEWCTISPISHLILSLSPASSFHGGSGAFYVVLKKS